MDHVATSLTTGMPPILGCIFLPQRNDNRLPTIILLVFRILRPESCSSVQRAISRFLGTLLKGDLVRSADFLGFTDPESVLVAFGYFFKRKSADFEVEEVNEYESELAKWTKG